MSRFTVYTYVDPKHNETEEDICLSNMKFADKHLNLRLMHSSCLAWLKLHPDKNYQDLEMLFRKHDLNTHMIAVCPKKNPNMKLKFPAATTNKIICKYEGIFCCRPKEYAIQELLLHSSSYDENFEKLKVAGMFVFCGNDIGKDELDKSFELPTKEQQRESDLIVNKKKKIEPVSRPWK